MSEGLEKFHSSASENFEPSADELKATYEGSVAMEMMDRQLEEGQVPTALFSDIENTFYRPEKVTAAQTLYQKAEEGNYPIIAVTGLAYDEVQRRVQAEQLPYFPIIIGSVGTEIWALHAEGEKKEYRKDYAYEQLLVQSGFDRETLAHRASLMINDFRGFHPDWQFDFQDPSAEERFRTAPASSADPSYQPFKISFHFFAQAEQLTQIGQMVHERFPDQVMVMCEEIHHNRTLPTNATVKKYCLDLLPISKGGAVNYLTKVMGVEQGIVAGDSGNDVDMLLESGVLNAVLVGGYKPEAKLALDKHVTVKKKGTRSFQKVTRPDGTVQALYIEQDPSRQAAESILHAAEILQRAERVKKLHEKDGADNS